MSTKPEIVRELARRLRPSQLGEEWQAVRDTVIALIDAVIRAHGGVERPVHDRQGYGAILCVPLDRHAAIVHIDTAVYFVESADPWTPRAGGRWRTPVRPSIVLIATDGPDLRGCANAALH